MIWDLGGDVVAADGSGIGFAGQGAQALETLDRLAKDKSVYVDPKPGSEQMYQVFLGGRMGMVATGPWQLPDIISAKVDYDVVPLPDATAGGRSRSRGPTPGPCSTTARRACGPPSTFLTWLMQPAQDVRWDVEAGSMPLSRPAQQLPAWRKQAADTPGLPVFIKALETARVRPTHPAYPQISQALGQAVVAVLLGKEHPRRSAARVRRRGQCRPAHPALRSVRMFACDPTPHHHLRPRTRGNGPGARPARRESGDRLGVHPPAVLSSSG